MVKNSVLSNKIKRRVRCRLKIADKIGSRLRISIFRSNKHIYIQVIDDSISRTLCSVSTLSKGYTSVNPDIKNRSNVANASLLGKLLAYKLKEVGLIDRKFVFDRAGLPYTGIVKNAAEAARENGVLF